MHTRSVRRAALKVAMACCGGVVWGMGVAVPRVLAAPPAPAWSSQFVSAGIVLDPFLDGPVCLFSHETADGPRLFVGGQFASIHTPGSSSAVHSPGVAVWDGVRWSGVQGSVGGGGLSTGFGDGEVRAITSIPVGGVSRVVLAGFFATPQSDDGIGYLDDARVLHPLASSPVTSAWFGGAFGWTPPSPPPPAVPSAPEIVVTSGIFPLGSEYAYRLSPSAYAPLPPGLVTVTNAFAVFDDGAGGGPALYIGVQMAGAEPSFTITRWNGTTLTPVNPGSMSWVSALCVHDDGSGPALYAAGQGNMRRLRNGAWESVAAGGPTFGVNALASFDDGSGPALYVAGQFSITAAGPAGPVTTTNIVRLRSGVWEALGGGLTGGAAKAMAVYDEDGPGPRPAGLFIVGKFTTVGGAGGISSAGIARWGLPICRADYDSRGGLQVDDLFAFLADWFAGSINADFNATNTLEVQDIFDYINAWFVGC